MYQGLDDNSMLLQNAQEGEQEAGRREKVKKTTGNYSKINSQKLPAAGQSYCQVTAVRKGSSRKYPENEKPVAVEGAAGERRKKSKKYKTK